MIGYNFSEMTSQFLFVKPQFNFDMFLLVVFILKPLDLDFSFF